MKRVLISWQAYNNDYEFESGKYISVNPNGTHAEFYNTFDEYDTHYLLHTPIKAGDFRFNDLVEYLRAKSKWEVTPLEINLNDPLDVGEIKQHVLEVLLELKDYRVEAYISPGTPSMQTAWYMLGQQYKFDLSLFFIRPPKFRTSVLPKREYLEFTSGTFQEATTITEKNKRISRSIKAIELESNKDAFRKARLIAQTSNVTALILGETGTGKDVISRFIHENSSRSGGPFIAINCSAYSDNLLESRLFGYTKGSFTSAINTVDGVFQKAHKGTLFLDEIGDISPKMQQTLLRAIETKAVNKIGTVKDDIIDIRIIAATNADLWSKVQSGHFRSDLYYRIAVAEIHLPPLRSYTDKDKTVLVKTLLSKVGKSSYGPKRLVLTKAANARLRSYGFPGNIRELIHLIERWYTFCDKTIDVNDIPSEKYLEEPQSLNLKEVEAKHIEKVLKMFPHSKKEVCKQLGIYNSTLDLKLKKYNLTFGRKNT